MGDVADFSNFMGAVIDAKAQKGHREAIELARERGDTEIVVGGGVDDSQGYFVEPTVIETERPGHAADARRALRPDRDGVRLPGGPVGRDARARRRDGAVRAHRRGLRRRPRARSIRAEDALRYAAGNFYVNDKPTGAVVGQQPFGGARASGTNDKAGSMWNLIRWVSPRTIKETFVPPRDYRYPFMATDQPDADGNGSGPPDRP